MVIAGSDAAVIMVESEAKELSEDQMLGGILFAHQEMQVAIEAIKEMASDIGKPDFEYQPKVLSSEVIDLVEKIVLQLSQKLTRFKLSKREFKAYLLLKNLYWKSTLQMKKDAPSSADLLDAVKKLKRRL